MTFKTKLIKILSVFRNQRQFTTANKNEERRKTRGTNSRLALVLHLIGQTIRT